MLTSLKLYLIIGALSAAFAGGFMVEHWRQGNLYKKALEKTLKAQQAQHEKDLALAKSQIKEVEVIKVETRTIVKKVRDVKTHSCPKLPDGLRGLYNDSNR